MKTTKTASFKMAVAIAYLVIGSVIAAISWAICGMTVHAAL